MLLRTAVRRPDNPEIFWKDQATRAKKAEKRGRCEFERGPLWFSSDKAPENSYTSIPASDKETFERFHVLAQARNTLHLEILEAVYIRNLTPSLCQQKILKQYTWLV